MEPLNHEMYYNMVNEYRMKHRTSALTMYDIQQFRDEYKCKIDPVRVLRYIVMGNACSWNNYEIACRHYDKYRELLDNLIEGIMLKGVLDP